MCCGVTKNKKHLLKIIAHLQKYWKISGHANILFTSSSHAENYSYKYSQIQWVEEKDQVFALEISEAHVLELPIVDSCPFKSRRRLGDSRGPSGSA